MIKNNFILLVLICLASPVHAEQNTPHNWFTSNTYTHTHQLELKPASLKNSYKIASVCFAGNFNTDCRDTPGEDKYSTTELLCMANGFAKTGDCPANEMPGQYCTNDPAYFDRCCNKAYNYTNDNCLYPNYLSSDSCSGKRKCLCDRRLYPSSSCTEPEVFKNPNDYCKELSYTAAGQIVSTTFYTGCACPDTYKICGKNQTGVGESCQGQYYAECECKAPYSSMCSGFGPMVGHETDFCLLDGVKYYQPQHCKTCANMGTLDSCPEGYSCILEACSLKYYISGCAIGYSAVNNCPWMKYFMRVLPIPVTETEN